MTSGIQFGPDWLLWAVGLLGALVGCFGIWSTVILIRKRRRNMTLPLPRLYGAGSGGWRRKRRSAESIIRQAAKFGAMMALGVALGWGWRDHQFNATRYTYTEVQIVARQDSKNFTVQPARMQPYDWTTCDPVDWEKNERMEWVYYRQREGCKDVTREGAYKFHEVNGKRIIYQEEIANAR